MIINLLEIPQRTNILAVKTIIGGKKKNLLKYIKYLRRHIA